MRDAIPLGVLAFAAGLFVADAVAAADGPLVVAAREFAALVLVTLAGALLAGSRTRGLLLLLAAFLLGAGIPDARTRRSRSPDERRGGFGDRGWPSRRAGPPKRPAWP